MCVPIINALLTVCGTDLMGHNCNLGNTKYVVPYLLRVKGKESVEGQQVKPEAKSNTQSETQSLVKFVPPGSIDLLLFIFENS